MLGLRMNEAQLWHPTTEPNKKLFARPKGAYSPVLFVRLEEAPLLSFLPSPILIHFGTFGCCKPLSNTNPDPSRETASPHLASATKPLKTNEMEDRFRMFRAGSHPKPSTQFRPKTQMAHLGRRSLEKIPKDRIKTRKC